jgi:hypothetical protein
MRIESTWTVLFTRKADKAKEKLPPGMKLVVRSLYINLHLCGPLQPNWAHFGKLESKKREIYHCHLNKGRPTYIVMWKVLDKKQRIMEISYVGTHENAPY